MKSFKQYQVGKVIIRKIDDTLFFDGSYCTEKPIHVILAILAVARHLKWTKGPFLNEYFDEKGVGHSSNWNISVNIRDVEWKDGKKPFLSQTTQSISEDTIYVNNKKVMAICSKGVDWAKMSYTQIVGTVNEAYYTGNKILMPIRNVFDIVELLHVEKIDPFIEFEDADYKKADKMFCAFMKEHCQKAKRYSFENEYFRKETGLPTAELVVYYLVWRWADLKVNGHRIHLPEQKKRRIKFEMR